MHISFGSDGYRGVLGHTFNREVVLRICLGLSAFVSEIEHRGYDGPIPIGYDTRFMAEPMARYCHRVLEADGKKSIICDKSRPSPYLSFAVKHHNAPVGIQITSSHNPPHYLGVKIKSNEGGSLTPDCVEFVENTANEVVLPNSSLGSLFGAVDNAKRFNIDKHYRKAIWEAAGWDGDADQSLIVDYMHGVGGDLYHQELMRSFALNTALRTEADPLFGGNKPEPLPSLLKELALRVVGDGLENTIGLAFDGDGDRLAVVDEQGKHLAPHEIFCLLLEHIATEQNRRGMVITSVSFSGLVERVASAYDCAVYDVPVGFKHVSAAMTEWDAVMGGEESGGTGFGHYLPERDALLMALILLAARNKAQKPLYQMVEDLYKTYGRPVFIRRDIQLPNSMSRENILDRISEMSSMDDLDGDEVTGLNHRDGMKVRTSEGWVLARASGTEPLVRIYAESDTEERTNAYADDVVAFLGLNKQSDIL